jgi:hypothetical protein
LARERRRGKEPLAPTQASMWGGSRKGQWRAVTAFRTWVVDEANLPRKPNRPGGALVPL